MRSERFELQHDGLHRPQVGQLQPDVGKQPAGNHEAAVGLGRGEPLRGDPPPVRFADLAAHPHAVGAIGIETGDGQPLGQPVTDVVDGGDHPHGVGAFRVHHAAGPQRGI